MSDDTLDGIWTPLHAELGGSPLPDEVMDAITLTVRDGRYHVQSDRGEVRLGAGARPATMDLIGDEGPNAGRTIHAIYERRGSLLRICYELGSADRPSVFRSEPGTLLFLVTYRRRALDNLP